MSARERRRSGKAMDAFLQAQQLAFAPLMFQAARALRDLGLLAAVEAGPLTVEEAARRAGLSPYGARVLLDAGVAMGLIEESAGRHALTLAGHLVLRDEMTRTNMDFVGDVCYAGAARLDEAVRTGRPAGLGVFGEWDTIYRALAALPARVQESWFRFDHSYSDAAFPQALAVVFERPPRRLLDVGGNTGRFALACLRHDPDVRVTILDHEGQLARALAAAAASGGAERIEGHALDLLDHALPFPGGFDAVWMSQFLDCFPEDDVVALLRRGTAALASGGRLFVLEPLIDRQPNAVGEYCLRAASLYFTCMANGTSRFYRAGELCALIERAGLRVEREVDRLGIGHTLLVCRPVRS